jgi:DNA-binding XRE family transcriptional regulator
MTAYSDLTDPAALQKLRERIEQHRIAANLTQAELAEQAGIGKRTLERIESGQGTELLTFIRVLRMLHLIEGLDRLLPDLPPSPIAQLKVRGKQRRRVTHSRAMAEVLAPTRSSVQVTATKSWSWNSPDAQPPQLAKRKPRA